MQEKYASEVVSKFGMAEAKVVSTPFEPGSTFGSDDVEDQGGVDSSMVEIPYRTLVGSMMYLAIFTRA